MVGTSWCTTTNHLNKMTKREENWPKRNSLRIPSPSVKLDIISRTTAHICIFNAPSHRPGQRWDYLHHARLHNSTTVLSTHFAVATAELLALLGAFHDRRSFGELLDFGSSCPLITAFVQQLVKRAQLPLRRASNNGRAIFFQVCVPQMPMSLS